MAQSQFDRDVAQAADTAARGIGAFLAGRDLDGQQRTDATFWRPGHRIRPQTEGRVTRASYRAGWHRLLVRLGGLSGTGFLALHAPDTENLQEWWHTDAALTTLQTAGIGTAAAAGAGSLAYGLLTRERRELMREWVRPLHQALAQPLGIPEQTDPRRYLHIPVDFSEDEAEIRIDLPTELRFRREQIADIVTQKLALEGVSFAWHPAGRHPYVLVKKTRKPPAKARFKDPKVRELVASAPESAPIIGVGPGMRPVSVDLDSESPHILVNASTGGGKSVILRTLTSQMLHHGAHAHILDYKRISHPWARGLPHVDYSADIADIHDALVHLGEEGRRRVGLADELGAATDPDAVGPRLLILLEEVNATLRQLARYWEKTREAQDPKISPAVDALNEILFMGRQVRIHVLLVAQSATARALGGPEVREQFSTRILARYTMNAWRMLAPEVHPAPKATKHPGRAQVVIGGTAHETQVLLFTDTEARTWATPTTPRWPVPVDLRKQPIDLHKPAPQLPPADDDSTPEEHDIDELNQHAPSGQPEPEEEKPVGLRWATEHLLPDLTLDALRYARANDPAFPEAAGKRGRELLYRADDLTHWARNRPRAPIGGTTDPDEDRG